MKKKFFRNFKSFKKKLLTAKIFFQLISEVGSSKTILLLLITTLINLFEIASIGLLITYFFNSNNFLIFNLQTKNLDNLTLLVIILIVIFRGFFQTYLKISQQRIKTEYVDNLREQLLNEIVFSPIEILNKLSRGNIIGLLLVDINRTVYSLDSGLKTLQQLISFLVYLTFLILISKFISLTLILGLISCFIAIAFQRSNSWELGQIQSKINSSLQKIIGDGLYGLKTIKSFSKEDWLLNKFSNENQKLRELLITILKKQTIFNYLRETIFIVLVIIFISLFSNNLDKPALSAIVVVSYKFSIIISRIIDLERACMNSLPGYRNLTKIRRKLKKSYFYFKKNKSYRKKLSKIKNSEINEFSWQSHNGFLTPLSQKGLSFVIGKLNIINGKSGYGKTTILDILSGLISPQDSTWILKSKSNIFSLSGIIGSNQLKLLISYCPQKDFIFEASLYENILLKEKNIISKNEKILINNFLNELGLEYILKKKEILEDSLIYNIFSPGEIKRICLLRNVFLEKQVEFYDEPTSFLDKESKKKVIDFLVKRSKSKILILITHDKDLINKSESILNLKKSDRLNLINVYR